MKKYWIAVVCLLPVMALSQSPIHGVKIASAGYDSRTRTVELDFVNDTANNITAWAYCIFAEKVKESDPNQGACTMIDVVGVEVDRQVQEKITLKENPADLPTFHFVHPGQHKILSTSFSLPIASANIQLKLIAYSDGSVERSADDWGADYFQQLLLERKAWLTAAQQVVAMGKKILGDPTNPHPAPAMVQQLESRRSEPGIDNTLYFFKKPEWRQGNQKEFIPDNERDYVTKFVTEKELQAAELSKYLIKEVRQ